MDRRQLLAFALAATTSALCSDLVAQSDGEGVTELSVSEVSNVIDDEDWVLVDTRASDAFNGWKLDAVRRGGHLPGAVDFPASWLDSDREDKDKILASALRVKGIEPHRRVVLYGVNQGDRDRVAAYLRKAGFSHVYDFDFQAWANDATKPLVQYKNFQLLVPPSIVKQLLDGQRPETFEHARQLKFVEVSWGEEDASYSKGHVPRSFHVNTDHFEPPPSWKLGSPDILHRFAEQYGFRVDDTVIISSEDPTAAYRLAIVLRYMGVADARVLNGGFAAWKAAKYPVETKRTPPPVAKAFGTQIPRRPSLIDDIVQVKAGLRSPHKFALVDTRSWAEFVGETSGYKYHSHKGRIPGSVFGQADYKGRKSLVPYRNIDKTMRNAAEIRMLWKKSGIDPQKHLSFMCGSGWRAAEVLTFAEVMGLPNVSLYSDGWIGWSNDRTNSVEAAPALQGVGR